MTVSKDTSRDLAPQCTGVFAQVTFVKKAAIPETASPQDWKALFEAALLEENPDLFAMRLQNARDAIVTEIEDSFDTASMSERRLLLAALNTIGGLYEADAQRPRGPRALGHSA
ncbi:MAG: hypothetical protein WBV46_04950 [Terriglobales bacterium]|jgi:hypothetical protein